MTSFLNITLEQKMRYFINKYFPEEKDDSKYQILKNFCDYFEKTGKRIYKIEPKNQGKTFGFIVTTISRKREGFSLKIKKQAFFVKLSLLGANEPLNSAAANIETYKLDYCNKTSNLQGGVGIRQQALCINGLTYLVSLRNSKFIQNPVGINCKTTELGGDLYILKQNVKKLNLSDVEQPGNLSFQQQEDGELRVFIVDAGQDPFAFKKLKPETPEERALVQYCYNAFPNALRRAYKANCATNPHPSDKFLHQQNLAAPTSGSATR